MNATRPIPAATSRPSGSSTPRRGTRALLAAAALALSSPPLLAENAVVQAVGVKFDALTVYIEPGETVSWEGMAGHNVETLGAMIPEGGVEMNTELGVDVTQQFDVPGIYVYKCTPHWGTRMGGVIVVGTPEDPQAILDGYLAAIEEDRGGLLPAKGLLKKAGKDMEAKGLI